MNFEIIYLILSLPFMLGSFFAFVGNIKEKNVSRCAMIFAVIYFLVYLVILVEWIMNGAIPVKVGAFELYSSSDYVFPVTFYIDRMSLVFLGLTAFLSNIVINYGRSYLHKELGYQRFFACLMFLIFGLTLLSLAGTLDLLFAGWEFIGICSFLLISFYQTRVGSVRNAFKVLTVYKFCDVGLLLAAWLSHLLWHEAQEFYFLDSVQGQMHFAGLDQSSILLLAIMLLIAAAGKSAQWPFTFWLTRAMEGPTPSSAIFYGALSVHAGVFLLYRVSPIWNAHLWGPWIVGTLGFITAVIASGIARIQANIKGQVAYSSAAHVGIMFIEMAMGLNTLVLVHLVANACLRCYQLLVSPSVIAYMLRLQGSDTKKLRPKLTLFETILPKKIYASWYVFCLNDGYLEVYAKYFLWSPLRKIGNLLKRNDRLLGWLLAGALASSIAILKIKIDIEFRSIYSIIASIATLAFSIRSFAENKSALKAWNLISISALSAGISIVILDPESLVDVTVYASGIISFWIVGLQSIVFLSQGRKKLSLMRYNGMSQIMPGGSIMLFIAVLGVSGFPISPTFIGQDLMLHHASSDSFWLVFALAAVFVINSLSLARIFMKVCLGDPFDTADFDYDAEEKMRRDAQLKLRML